MSIRIQSETNDKSNHEVVILSKKAGKYEGQYFWSEDYLKMAEDNFECVFQDIYEESFVNAIFEKNESLIEKEDFIASISGTLAGDFQ